MNVLDSDVRKVVEFMQTEIEAQRLVGVADCLPQMARLLWEQVPQEPVRALQLVVPKPRPSQSDASGSVVLADAGGDSAAATACHL